MRRRRRSDAGSIPLGMSAFIPAVAAPVASVAKAAAVAAPRAASAPEAGMGSRDSRSTLQLWV